MKGEKGERRRQELLKITYQLFIQKGYEQTSVDDITAEAAEEIAVGSEFSDNYAIGGDIDRGEYSYRHIALPSDQKDHCVFSYQGIIIFFNNNCTNFII